MNLKKLQLSIVLFFLLVVLVGATLEDSSLTLPETLDATLDQENDTTAQIVEQEENLVIGDINKENILEEQKTENEEALEEDTFNGLQPSLPGPKPENLGNDNPTGLELGETWERTCTETECIHTIYQAQKYYQHNEQWQEIDESFYSTPCNTGYDFCVVDNLYQVHMKSYPDTTNTIHITFNDLDLGFSPTALTFAANNNRQNISTIQRSPAQVTNNRAQYPSAFSSNFDLHFMYLPRMFKEELIIQTKQALPAATLSPNPQAITFDVSFALDVDASAQIYIDNQLWNRQTAQTTFNQIEIRQNDTSLYLTQPIAYDAVGAVKLLRYTVENRQNILYITLQTPYDWLMNATRVYPVVIDPTITLDSNNIIWDGTVSYETESDATWSRYGLASNLGIGDVNLSPNPGYQHTRTDIDWNISSLPDSAQIQDLQLNLYFEAVDATNDEVRIYPMIGGNNHYPDNDDGNSAFYDDMSNGIEYARQQAIVSTLNTFNITTNASQDLQTVLLNGTDIWSTGIRSEESGGSTANASYFTSSEGSISANRPALVVMYEPSATETEGDAAIEQGIVNVLPNAVIHDTQQIYIRTANNTQQLGTFDKFTPNATKRWSMNYITSGETFANMQNLSDSVFFLELTNLLAADITQRVQDFINGTA